jgi:DNA-binding transcriptional MerR regulator
MSAFEAWLKERKLDPEHGWYHTSAAADAVGISVSTLKRWRHTGFGPKPTTHIGYGTTPLHLYSKADVAELQRLKGTRKTGPPKAEAAT